MFSALLLSAALLHAEPDGAKHYFAVTVVDDETGRGVPLIELRTVNDLRYYTDSNGVVAFREPGLMDTDVFFHVSGPGYEYPADGFGHRGARLHVTAGGAARLKVHRVNIAERLYRLTGGGIYADSVLAGVKAPLRQPVLDGQVFGSDTVLNAVHNGKIYWFWGDTNRPSYPLGNFNVPGAVSELPAHGGLDPETGVDLDYFLDAKGFAKETARMPGKGPTWLTALTPLTDADGRERLYGSYVKVEPPLKVYGRGLMAFDDDKRGVREAGRLGHEDARVPVGPRLPADGGRRRIRLFRQSLSANACSRRRRTLSRPRRVRMLHLSEGGVAPGRAGARPRRGRPARATPGRRTRPPSARRSRSVSSPTAR